MTTLRCWATAGEAKGRDGERQAAQVHLAEIPCVLAA